MSKMRVFCSATTISPTVQTDALSDIDINYTPAIRREPKNPSPKHTQKITMPPQQNFIAGQNFLSQQAEYNADEQYNFPEEINIGVQNSNLLLTSDHEYTDPFERPPWGGIVVYLNTIMKWYGVTPQSNLYFNKNNLSPKKTAPRLYLGNPTKTTMGRIKVNKLKNLMKKRNVDVEVVDLPSILGSTEYKKDLFLIQGYARRGEKMKNNKDGVPEATPMWRAKKEKKDDPFFEHTIILEPAVGIYIDHVLCSKNGCLILNPASHLKLHHNLHGGYLKEIKFIVKLTCTKSENPYSQIDASIDGIPYHKKEEEVELKEYFKRTLGVNAEIGSTDPLMKIMSAFSN
jgi:hypothetical protein